MLDIVLFIVFPAESKGLSFWNTSRLLVKTTHGVSVRGRFLFSVSENNWWNWLFVAFPKSTTFGSQWGRNLRLENVTVVCRAIFETVVFGEAIFMRSVSPSAGWLIPLGSFFGHGDMGVTEEDRRIRPMLIIEVGGVRLIAAHMMSRYHALILLYPIDTCHLNKFNQSNYFKKFKAMRAYMPSFLYFCFWDHYWNLKNNATISSTTFFVLRGFCRFGQLIPSWPYVSVVFYCQFFFQFASQLNKNLLYMVILLCRTLHISQVLLTAKLLNLILRDLPLFLQIWLIPDEEKYCIFFSISFHLVHPKLADIFETEWICQIKNQ